MDFSNDFFVFLISLSPVVELRGAIPVGIAKGMGVWRVFFLALTGNSLPIIPLLVFLRWAVKKLENLKWIGRILHWWFTKVEKKSKVVHKYGFWGLVLFVAIPFPGTGVWSGTVAATLLEFKFSRAFLAIFLGMVIAGILVTLGTGVIKIWFLRV